MVLGTDPLTAVAAQNVGASSAVMASPPRVALALSVAAATADAEPGADQEDREPPASAPVTRVVMLVSLAIALVLGEATMAVS